MIQVDTPYEIPALATGRLVHSGIREQGNLMDLLAVYERLSAPEKQKSSILLDQRITMPTQLSGMVRGGRLNLFDGEIALLLPYYRIANEARQISEAL